MPLYDYKCSGCERVVELFLTLKEFEGKIFCSICASRMESQISRGHGGHQGSWTGAGVWEDFGDHSIEIRSPKHLKEVCDKHNMRAEGYM